MKHEITVVSCPPVRTYNLTLTTYNNTKPNLLILRKNYESFFEKISDINTEKETTHPFSFTALTACYLSRNSITIDPSFTLWLDLI
jgi:hypothetical protein